MIWKLAATDDRPRIVRFKWYNRKKPGPLLRLEAGPIPTLLILNKESRTEMQRIYRKVKAYDLDIPDKLKTAMERYTYINFKSDIIYYDPKFFGVVLDPRYPGNCHARVFSDWGQKLKQGKLIIADNLSHRFEYIRHAAVPSEAYQSWHLHKKEVRAQDPLVVVATGNASLQTVKLVLDCSKFFAKKAQGKPPPGAAQYGLIKINKSTDISYLPYDDDYNTFLKNRLVARKLQGFECLEKLKGTLLTILTDDDWSWHEEGCLFVCHVSVCPVR